LIIFIAVTTNFITIEIVGCPCLNIKLISLYLHMNDVYEIIQGSQMLNIAVIQLWIL